MAKPNEALRLKIAKLIFTSVFPDKAWLLHPSVAQARVQARYLRMAGLSILMCHAERDKLLEDQ